MTDTLTEAPKKRGKQAQVKRGDGDLPEENDVVNNENENEGNDENEQSLVDQHNAQLEKEISEQAEKSREQEIEEAQEELAKLDPTTVPVRWMIGQPPEHGGKEDDYAIFVQDKLPWMPRARFFSLVSKTMSQAIKASGGTVGGLEDVFGDGGGSLIERGRRLTQRDFGDAASFMTLAFELIGYSPEFLIECYIIWLDVPRADRGWAKLRFSEPWKPEEDKWGLKDEDHRKLIETFIDQNYEDIRSFFGEELPAIARRAALHEKAKDRKTKSKGRKSASAQSKSSSTSGPEEEATS